MNPSAHVVITISTNFFNNVVYYLTIASSLLPPRGLGMRLYLLQISGIRHP